MRWTRALVKTTVVAWTAAALLALPAGLLAAEKNINVVEDSPNDNGVLPQLAQHFPNSLRVTSKADLAKKVLGALGPGDCIKTLTIAGHGAPGIIGTGDGQGNEQCKHINGNSAEWKPALQGLKGKFCPGAKIVLWGCHVGAGTEGAAKVKEIADYFGVPVEAQTGTVYGDGTTEPGSQTVTGTPTNPAPPPATTPSGPCKKKRKKGERPAQVVFPAQNGRPVLVSEIASAAFIPSSLFSVAFTTPLGGNLAATATLTPDGQIIAEQNAVQSPSLLQQITAGVATDMLGSTEGVGTKLNAGMVLRLTSGETLLYFITGDFAYVLDHGDAANTLETTCEGSALYRLLTEEPLAHTILNAKLADATENLLLTLAIKAATLAEQNDYASAREALALLNAETEARLASGEIAPENASQIVFESVQLQNGYAAEHGGADTQPSDGETSTPR